MIVIIKIVVVPISRLTGVVHIVRKLIVQHHVRCHSHINLRTTLLDYIGKKEEEEEEDGKISR